MNGDALWVWCFPSVDSDLRRVLLSKSCLTQDGRDLHAFVFGQFRRTWYYVTTAEVQEPTALTKVRRRRCHDDEDPPEGCFSVRPLKFRFFLSLIFSVPGHSLFNSCHSERLQP